jgi:hypothetical protein
MTHTGAHHSVTSAAAKQAAPAKAVSPNEAKKKNPRLVRTVVSPNAASPGPRLKKPHRVFTRRDENGIWMLYVKKASRDSAGFVYPLVEMFRNRELDATWNGVIDEIVSRRDSTKPDEQETIKADVDSAYDFLQFVKIVKQDDDNTPENLKAWGVNFCTKLTELTHTKAFSYENRFVLVEDLTESPPRLPVPWQTLFWTKTL